MLIQIINDPNARMPFLILAFLVFVAIIRFTD
jgi:hypothetical protein